MKFLKLKLFNCLETIAILVRKQVSSNSFKDEITDKLILYVMYDYLNVCKQMTGAKLFVLHCNTWNHLIVSQQIITWLVGSLVFMAYQPF